MTTELTRFTQWAKEKPQKRYTALMGLLAAVEGLADSFHRQPSRKAVGVDGVDKADYGLKLEANLTDLSARLKRMATVRSRRAACTYPNPTAAVAR